jgi:hypothetical protein
MITMVLYAVGTASCAFVTEMWQLVSSASSRSLGIGGEWAAGSAMVAEVVPEGIARRAPRAVVHVGPPFRLVSSRHFVNAGSGRELVRLMTLRMSGVTCCCSPGFRPSSPSSSVCFVTRPERWASACRQRRRRRRVREIFFTGHFRGHPAPLSI